MSTSGGTGPAGTMQRASVALTAAQILTLDTVPVQMLAAPGADQAYNIFQIVFAFEVGTILFNGGVGIAAGADDLVLKLGAVEVQGCHFAADTLWRRPDDRFGFDPAAQNVLAGVAGQPLNVAADNPANYGPISASVLNAGGAAYAVGDTGTVDTGSADATYVVDTVAPVTGAVTAYHLTSGGGAYPAPQVGVTTTPGGAQPGAGAGLTVDITNVTRGNGTITVIAYYTVETV